MRDADSGFEDGIAFINPESAFRIRQTRAKSMKPRSGSVERRRTRTRSPTSRPRQPRTTRPSAGGRRVRANVYARARNGWTARKAAQSGLHEHIADMLQRAETEGAPKILSVN